MKTALSAAVVALAAGSLSAQVFSFAAVNHTDGNVNPQAYGMRLDNFGGESPATFSFLDSLNMSTVTLTLDLSAGFSNAVVSISGVVTGNSANGGTDFGAFQLDVSYGGTWDAGTLQFTSAPGDAFSGSVTGLATTGASPIGDGDSFALSTMTRDGAVFRFGDNLPGSRRNAGDNRLEAFGWLGSSQSSGTEDFLFLVEAEGGDVPTPASAALIGAGGLIAARRRRS